MKIYLGTVSERGVMKSHWFCFLKFGIQKYDSGCPVGTSLRVVEMSSVRRPIWLHSIPTSLLRTLVFRSAKLYSQTWNPPPTAAVNAIRVGSFGFHDASVQWELILVGILESLPVDSETS